MPPRRRNKDEEADSEEEELQALPSDEEEEEEEYVTLPRLRQPLCFWDCATGSRCSARLVIVDCLKFVLKAAPDLNHFGPLRHVRQGADPAVITELFAIVDLLTGLLTLVRAQV